MNNLTIDNLGKRYLVTRGRPAAPAAGDGQRSRGLRAIRDWFRTSASALTGNTQEFWALRDVSLNVAPGTILGVIGANGAGKTTLLKIIARVTAPTEGRVVGVGRVVSLLELGAGFNPELPALENVLMNAALNGFTKQDALKRFDEIIEFAEMGEFLDQPLKSYSSGMYLRLAFSVAVNMQPRILLADEILAVGDLAFQERCLERVEQMGKQGLTVLFVSHDMDAVMRVCNRVVWLDGGKLAKDGDPEEVVTEYQNASWARADAARSEKGRSHNRWAEILSVRIVSGAGKEVGAPAVNEPFFIRVRFRTHRGRLGVKAAVDLHARKAHLFRAMDDEFRELAQAAVYDAYLKIPAHLLSDTSYTAGVTLVIERDGKEYVLVNYNAVSFMAYSSDEARTRTRREGLIAPRLEWTLEKVDSAA